MKSYFNQTAPSLSILITPITTTSPASSKPKMASAFPNFDWDFSPNPALEIYDDLEPSFHFPLYTLPFKPPELRYSPPKFSPTKRILRSRYDLAREVLTFLYTNTETKARQTGHPLTDEALRALLHTKWETCPQSLVGAKQGDFDSMYRCIDQVLHSPPLENSVVAWPSDAKCEKFENPWEKYFDELLEEILEN